MSSHDSDCEPTYLTRADEEILRLAADIECPDCPSEKLFGCWGGTWRVALIHDQDCPLHRGLMGGAA
jgi:hypothetical protein